MGRAPAVRRAPDLARGARVALALAAAAASAAPARAAPPGSPWGEAYFPDVALRTHDGRTVRFYSELVRDQHVVVSFVYTRCRKVCGLMTANLARVQRELGGRVGKDIHFYSVTLEPEHDTPATLAAYAAAYKAGPGWTFLTGAPADVALLRRKFGDLAPVEEHAPRVHVGNDRTGTWWSTAATDDPKYLATVIGGWMDPAFDGAARVAARGYTGAPRVAAAPRGQAAFRQKCAACHVPGGDSVGPDLRGVVARRGVGWLRRWLAAPERMIAERDPVALALLARHGGVPMPNLGLGAAEIDELIGFMRTADEAEGGDARERGARAAPAAGE